MPFSSGITLSIFFSFYMNSFLHAENPAGQVMMGKMVPKMDPSPHPHSLCSIHSRDFSGSGRGDTELDMFVSVLPYTAFN